ncbi:MAG: hypothetical protein PWQ15_1192 [Methanobacterium sp.]|jgi:hypothetical protein|uniref:hypothetical protein n=1 Tax=Methanobacterium sp. TaxID=2164 RepID=UPI0003C9C145|nr:hypothetical protein [Methanobacterium sp.]MDI3550090.1 hypothetical protein [Methanobacterium sp.]CDG65030.1 hypothetical protein MBMB1_0928 [Methanobacterium sp. MB1]
MTYLICESCGGYYQLKEGERVEDFSDECECGGKLFYTENLPETEEEEIYLDQTESTSCADEYMEQDSVEEKILVNNLSENIVQSDYQNDTESLVNDGSEDIKTTEDNQTEDIETATKFSQQDKKRKEYKYALELKEILDLRGLYIIKERVGGKSFKVLSEGIETYNGQFIKFTDIISVEDNSKEPIVEKESGIAGLLSYGRSLLSSTHRTIKIRYSEGEIEFKNIKKNDAQRLVSYINRLINKK